RHRDPVRQRQHGDQEEGQVGRPHVDLTFGEVRDVRGAEHDHDRDGEERVYRAGHEPGGDPLLHEQEEDVERHRLSLKEAEDIIGGGRRESRAGQAQTYCAGAYFQRLAKTPGTVVILSPSNLMKIEAFWAARSFSLNAIGPAMTPESKFSFL